MRRQLTFTVIASILHLATPAVLKATLSFDGNDTINNQPMDYQSKSFTIDAWIKTSQTSIGRIVTLPKNGKQAFSLAINIEPTKAEIRFDAQDGSGAVRAVSQTAINDGQWHHLAGVFDANAQRLTLFVDGAPETSVTTPAHPLAASTDLRYGYFSDTIGQNYEGLMDEARFWNGALSGAQINYVSSFRQQGWETLDKVGLPAVGMPWLQQNYPDDYARARWPGTIDRFPTASNDSPILPTRNVPSLGMLRMGSGAYYTIPHDVNHVSPSFTIETWVAWNGAKNQPERFITKPADTPGLQRFSLLANASPGTIEFRIDPMVNLNGAFVARSSPLPDPAPGHTVYYHVAGVFDSAEKKIQLFLNGELETEHTVVGGPQDTIQPLQIGRYSETDPQSYSGLLDEIRFWTVARSRAEIYDSFHRSLTYQDYDPTWTMDRGNRRVPLIAYYPILGRDDYQQLVDYSSYQFAQNGTTKVPATFPFNPLTILKQEVRRGLPIYEVCIFEKASRSTAKVRAPWLAYDGKITTGNLLAAGDSRSTQIVAMDLGDAIKIVNRLRVAKNGVIDSTGIANMNLRILFSNESGPLNQRAYHPVRGLTNGFQGKEKIRADRVDENGVHRDHHHFDDDGFYSLSFYDVAATAIAIEVTRDGGDSERWCHYAPLEMSLYHESQGVPTQLKEALAFNGINHYVDNITYQPGSDHSYTIETWVRAKEVPRDYGRMITRTSDDQETQQFSLYLDSTGKPAIRMDTSAGAVAAIGDQSILNTGWRHVAGVYSQAEGQLKLYLDGIKVQSVAASTPPIDSTRAILLGRFSAKYGQYFRGVLDEVRIWNIARTDSQISLSSKYLLTGYEPGLIAYFPMNEGWGEQILDFTPQKNVGFLHNSPVWTHSDRIESLVPPTNYSLKKLLSLPGIERPAANTTITGLKNATIQLKNLYGFPPRAVPEKGNRILNSLFGPIVGLVIWEGMPFPIKSAQVQQNPPRLTLQCGFNLPVVTDLAGKPMAETVEINISESGEVSFAGGQISIPGIYKIPKTNLRVGDIQIDYLPSENLFGGGLLVGWGEGKQDDLCKDLDTPEAPDPNRDPNKAGDSDSEDGQGPRMYGGKFRVRDGALQSITVGGKELRLPLAAGAFVDELSLTLRGLDKVSLDTSLTSSLDLEGFVKANVGCKNFPTPAGKTFPLSAHANAIWNMGVGSLSIKGGVSILAYPNTISGLFYYEPPYKVVGNAKLDILTVYQAEAKYVVNPPSQLAGTTTGKLTLPKDLKIFNRNALTRLAAGGGPTIPGVEATFDDKGNFVGSFQLAKSIGTVKCGKTCGNVCDSSVVGWIADHLKVNCRQVCDDSCKTVNKVLSTKVSFTIGSDDISYDVGSVEKASLNFPTPLPTTNLLPQFRDEESGQTITLYTNFDPLPTYSSNHPLQRRANVTTLNQANTTFVVPEGSPSVIVQIDYENETATNLPIQLILPDETELVLQEGSLPHGFSTVSGYSEIHWDQQAAQMYLFAPEAGEYTVRIGDPESLGEFQVTALSQDPEPFVEILDFDEGSSMGTPFRITYRSGDLGTAPENRFYLVDSAQNRIGYEIYPIELREGPTASEAAFSRTNLEISPGRYHLMVTADDGRNARVEAHTIGTVFIDHPLAPEPVTQIRTRSIQGGFHIEWDPSPSTDTNYYIVRYTSAPDFSGIPQTQVVSGETNQTTVTGLTNGVPYLVTVVAVNSDQHRSEMATVHRVIPTNGTGLNPPTIVSTPHEFATADYPYFYAPQTYDADTISFSDIPENVAAANPELRVIEAGDTWRLVQGPAGMTIDVNSGALFWEPALDQVGRFPVTLRVQEPDLAQVGALHFPRSATQSFEIEVLPNDNINGLKEHPFQFWSHPMLIAKESTTYHYPVRLLGANADDFLLELLQAPSGMEITENQEIIWDVPRGAETQTVWLRAHIPFGETAIELDQQFILHVEREDNQLPELLHLSGIQLDGPDILLRWTGSAPAYRIETTSSLDHPMWRPVSDVIDHQSVNSWKVPAVDSQLQFFRIVEVASN